MGAETIPAPWDQAQKITPPVMAMRAATTMSTTRQVLPVFLIVAVVIMVLLRNRRGKCTPARGIGRPAGHFENSTPLRRY
jgi:hypothetical protein